MRRIKESFHDPYMIAFLIIISVLCIVTGFLHIPWYLVCLGEGVLFLILIAFLTHREMKTVFWARHATHRAIKQLRKNGDVIAFYRFFDDEFLPRIRTQIPKTLYKYYSLSEDESLNDTKFSTIAKCQIWASLGAAFNDPYEGEFSYLTEKDCETAKLPENAVSFWKSIVTAIKERTTIICFSQKPNDLAMWGYYTNAHRGFCIEYRVTDTSNLYPVIYDKHRVSSVALFIQFAYSFFCKEATKEDHQQPLKYMMFLNAFKHKSWEHEQEIRAIFLDSINNIHNNGQALSCETVGVKPIRIYAGINCSEAHRLRLKQIAEEQGIVYEECHLSDNDFSVMRKTTMPTNRKLT